VNEARQVQIQVSYYPRNWGLYIPYGALILWVYIFANFANWKRSREIFETPPTEA